MEGKDLTCILCGIPFLKQLDLQNHIILHVNKPYECENCGQRFIKKSGFDTHLRTHKTEEIKVEKLEYEPIKTENIEEEQSGNFFSEVKKAIIKKSQSFLEESETRDSISRNLPTSTKDSKFSIKDTLARQEAQLRQFAGENKPKNITDIVLNSEDENNNSFVKKEKPFYQVNTGPWLPKPKGRPECVPCGKTFGAYNDLKIHLSISKAHTLEGAVRCEICKRVYANEICLRQHQRFHTKLSNFVCKICGKGSRGQRDLDLHLRRHMGDRPHKCQICPKAFTQKCDLTRHEQVHMDVKRHKCPYCPKTLAEKTAIRKHIYSQHKGKEVNI